MHYLYCSHKVEDYDRWRKVFDAEREAQEAAGLRTLHVLRDGADPDFVFMLFAVEDPERALAFTETPEAAQAGEAAGVCGVPEMRLLTDGAP